MEALTVAEALELIRINEEAMSTQFETWLTITFATIVSVFVGKHLLNRVIRWLITLLYSLASLMVIAMAIYLAESNARLVLVLAKMGAEVEGPVFAGAVALFLFLAGVGTTIYFIHMDTDRGST
jgi:undecaprenyl pyrophosphate phosphatase UppP